MKTLLLMPGRFGICRMPANHPLPDWALAPSFFSVTRAPEELSVICDEQSIPEEVRSHKGWRILQLEGQYDFSEVGVLLPIVDALARARVSILTLASFDTDYVMIKDETLPQARRALEDSGYRVIDKPEP